MAKFIDCLSLINSFYYRKVVLRDRNKKKEQKGKLMKQFEKARRKCFSHIHAPCFLHSVLHARLLRASFPLDNENLTEGRGRFPLESKD